MVAMREPSKDQKLDRGKAALMGWQMVAMMAAMWDSWMDSPKADMMADKLESY